MAIFRRKAPKKIHNAQKKFSIESLLHENNATIPIELEKILKTLDIRLKTQEMDPQVSGYLKKINNHWVIGVNALHHPNRKRFTIAHELAHYCLHSELMESFEDTILFRKGESNTYETEANKFAAELLMPTKDFKNYVNNISTNIEEIANHYKVSTMAVRIRANELGFGGHEV